ncbi:MAG TPA: hypothetical protein VG603_13660, partial [Chitinophagales bacterium]|nr:hypothetical protein [Chitinophagales bacterium]
MDTRKIDIANIFLMLISCVLAFVLPFELFLFSYAVLGPLHYLTEITWLKKRDYFTNGKKDYIWLVLPCVALSFITLIDRYNNLPIVSSIYTTVNSVFGDKL